MGAGTPSLRRRLSVAIVVLTTLVAVSASAIVWLSSALASAAEESRAAVESVHDAERAQVALLLLERATHPLARASLQRMLEEQLRLARTHVTDAAEDELLARATAEADAYLAGSAEAAPRAYALLDQLVAMNLDEARTLKGHAERIDTLGDALGVGIAVVVVVGGGLLVWWVRSRAFEPVLALARVMEAFGAGRTDVRADEEGAAELVAMARRFNAMADAIESQRKAQLTFLAGVAHDLRNPLHALLMASNLVRPDDPMPSEPVVRQLFERVRRSVHKLDRMVGDLLDSARVESGQLDLKLERVDAVALATQVVDLFSDVSRRHRLRLAAPAEPVWVWCDGGRLEQVLGNLASNAIKYSPDGGDVSLAVEPRRDEVCFSVSDTGLGMTEQELAHLFEPFRRSARVAADIPGVGLGLFVVRRIVEAHGGSLQVESRPGAGSTFRVTLPADLDVTAPPADLDVTAPRAADEVAEGR
jgi:signal transduction histidine kinase